MSAIEKIILKAKSTVRHIVLPEGSEPRTVQASALIVERGIAKVTLLGNPEEIKAVAKETNTNLDGVNILNPVTSEKVEEYTNVLFEMRKSKGLTEEQAKELIVGNTLYFGTVMVQVGDADGLVAGAINSTSNVLRPALQIIKAAPGMKVVSSCFIMDFPDKSWGEDGVMIYADCGVIPDPTAEELVAIALASAETGVSLLDFNPRIAMLSFSTKGSASHPAVTKMQEATALTKAAAPDLIIDGELQGDAALVKEVADLKAPGSPLKGEANILIFPDLGAGNICYKLSQRLTGGESYGPIIQGLAKPVSDLSRGCSVEEIVNVVAITAAKVK